MPVTLLPEQIRWRWVEYDFRLRTDRLKQFLPTRTIEGPFDLAQDEMGHRDPFGRRAYAKPLVERRQDIPDLDRLVHQSYMNACGCHCKCPALRLLPTETRPSPGTTCSPYGSHTLPSRRFEARPGHRAAGPVIDSDR